jgi:hypothetical protein
VRAVTLDQYFKDWERRVRAMSTEDAKDQANHPGGAPGQVAAWPEGMDWSKLKASDIGVRFGKPMTREEFLEYRKQRQDSGSSAPVVVRPSPSAPTKKP